MQSTNKKRNYEQKTVEQIYEFLETKVHTKKRKKFIKYVT